MSQTWSIILGAVIALVTSLGVEIYKNTILKLGNRKNFKTVFTLELKHFLDLIDKLNQDFSSNNFFFIFDNRSA